jgi:MSHA biogenesis protein MshL
VILAVALQAPPQRPVMPTLPLTQLDERAFAADLDNRTFTLTFAQAVPLSDLLLLLVRGTSLSVVPGPGVTGSFIGELKNVTVRQALDFILRPLGLDYAVEGGVVRVFRREPETRLFDINYIAAERTGTTTVGSDPAAHAYASVSTSARSDVFADLSRGVQALLSDRATFNVDRKAGLLQVTDFPERLDRVALYIEAVQDHVQRQVQIDARVIEVALNDENAESLDWSAVARQLGATDAAVSRSAAARSLLGVRVMDVSRLMTALEAQGTVSLVAKPRMTTVNNEPAIVRTDPVTISVTPQIAPDASIMLSVSPIVKAPAAVESDMLARVADGETLVIAGLLGDRETRERRNLGIRGGLFGRGTAVTRARTELLVLVTPRIVAAAETR